MACACQNPWKHSCNEGTDSSISIPSQWSHNGHSMDTQWTHQWTLQWTLEKPDICRACAWLKISILSNHLITWCRMSAFYSVHCSVHWCVHCVSIECPLKARCQKSNVILRQWGIRVTRYWIEDKRRVWLSDDPQPVYKVTSDDPLFPPNQCCRRHDFVLSLFIWIFLLTGPTTLNEGERGWQTLWKVGRVWSYFIARWSVDKAERWLLTVVDGVAT